MKGKGKLKLCGQYSGYIIRRVATSMTSFIREGPSAVVSLKFAQFSLESVCVADLCYKDGDTLIGLGIIQLSDLTTLLLLNHVS